MKTLSVNEVFQIVCKSEKKWGVRISIRDDSDEASIDTSFLHAEICKAAPYLDYRKPGSFRMMEYIFNDGGIMLFDTEAEMREIYGQTVGEDGPTSTNKYEGMARVYAITCNPKGELLTENT